MKLILPVLLIFFNIGELLSQADDITVNRVRRTLSAANNVSTIPSGMRTLPLQASELEGSYYLQEDYVPTNFILSADETVSNVPAKYNVRTNVFIINVNDSYGSLRGNLVREFSFFDGLADRRYVSSSTMPFNPLVSGTGFYNILYEGENIMLLGKTTYDIIPSNYNVALDVGERKSYIKLKTDYFILENSNYKQLRKFTKKNLAIFGGKKSDMKKFIESESIDHKNEADLIKTIHYYQSLLAM